MAINSVHLASQAGAGARTKVADNTSVGTSESSKSAATSSAAKGTQGATVQLSDTAQSIKNAERKMADTPDINQEKVDRLKAAIDSGDYKVNTERTAAGIMNMDNLLG